jgi:hypothetical protein
MSIVMSCVVIAGCSKSEKSKPAESAKAAAAKSAAKPLPGTEKVQSLLRDVGKSASPSAGTATALGGIFGKTGVLGGGPSMGEGFTGGGSDDGGDKKNDDGDIAIADEPKPTPPPNVVIPPPVASGGDCVAVAKRITDLGRAMATAELGDLEPDMKKQMEDMIESTIGGMEQMVRDACTAQAWPTELKDCLLTAPDFASLQACERFVTPAMKAEAEKMAAEMTGPAPRPTTPAPVWTGASSDCTAVATHAAAILEWELSAAPDAQRDLAADLIPQVRSSVEDMCKAASWPDTVRTCILKAASSDALSTCASGS